METVMIEQDIPEIDKSISLPKTQFEVLMMVANLGKGKSITCEKLHKNQHAVHVGNGYVSLCPDCIRELRENTAKYSKRLMLTEIPIQEIC